MSERYPFTDDELEYLRYLERIGVPIEQRSTKLAMHNIRRKKP